MKEEGEKQVSFKDKMKFFEQEIAEQKSTKPKTREYILNICSITFEKDSILFSIHLKVIWSLGHCNRPLMAATEAHFLPKSMVQFSKILVLFQKCEYFSPL